MSLPLPWFARYVGIPFVDHGRDFKGVDCWGLVRLILQHERALNLPSYGEISARDLLSVAGIVQEETAGERWLPVPAGSVRAFDVSVMHRRHRPTHLGLMVSSKEMMHVEEKIATVVLPLTHPSLAFRSIAFFRHRDLI